MKKLIVILSLMVLLLGAGSARAITINFDSAIENNFLNSYEGFTWDNMYAISYSLYNSTVYNNTLTAISGNLFATNANGIAASMASGDDFDFDGVYLTGWTLYNGEWYANAHSVTINGYNNGVLVDTYVAQLSLGAWTYFNVGMNNVDKLVFTTDGEQRWFLMDDFSYHASASEVPEPMTLLLLGFGLIGVASLKRRIK